jgi:hypothetical protein
MATFKKLKTSYTSDHCPIATVKLNNFNPNTIIKTIDYSNLITENSIGYNVITKLTYSSGIIPNSGVFPIERFLSENDYNVDFYITEKVNQDNEPLFFVYELMFDALTYTKDDAIQIFKNNIEKIPANSYKLEFGSTLLYDNYVESNDPDLSRYGTKVVWGDFDSTKSINRVRILLPLSFYNENEFYTVRYIKNYMHIDFNNHMELLELNRLYNQNDYVIYDHNIVILTNKIDSNNLNTLYIVKNPYTQVKTEGIVNVITEGDQSNANSSWNIRVNTGNFITSDSNFNSDTSFYQIKYSADSTKMYQPLSFIKPNILGNNIYQIIESPIYIDGYNYPDYKIQLFPNVTDGNDLPKGSLGINLDNTLLKDVYISSIDRYKGYILFNKSFDTVQDVAFFVYVDLNYSIYIRNLELNPRISGIYGISSNSQTSFKDIGIAVRKYDVNNQTSFQYLFDIEIYNSSNMESFHPYFFDFNNPTIFYRAEVVSTTSPATTVIGNLNWNPYTANYNPSGEFIPIAMISLNELSLDVLSITDARVIAGGLDKSKLNYLKNNENNSFVDIGYYDGELLPHEGLKIIHLPSFIYPNLIEKWKNSGLFNQNLYTDISEYELELLKQSTDPNDIATVEYYNNLLEGKSSNGEIY